MFNLPMLLDTGHLIVFEGLDDTGKSTQMERIERACHTPALGDKLYKPTPVFTHQPSGATGIGPDIYELTESVDWSESHPLTRQLLHLAAHNEHYTHDIIPALQKRSVFMDRCWWSTFAYGYRGEVKKMFTAEKFMELCQMPARGIMPSVVFLFTHRHKAKASQKSTSSDRITLENYLHLQGLFHDQTVIVPDLAVGEVGAFISGKLYERGFVKT